jgi:phosphomannomutase
MAFDVALDAKRGEIGAQRIRHDGPMCSMSIEHTMIPRRPAFLDYDPVSLAFGTSGLRGLVKDITDLEAYINVKGGLRYLLATGDIPPASRVILGGDLRPSTDRILVAAASAIVDTGCRVENGGRIPTPALVARALGERCAGVMVTGSHIPFDRNGIKINRSVGEVLKSDEPGITREVERVRAEEYGRSSEESRFGPNGGLKVSHPLPPVDGSAEESYVRRYVDAFPADALQGLRVVVYQHSAVGRDILPRILHALGADVVAAGRSDTFVALDTENVVAEQLDVLEALAVGAERGGPPVDAVVSTDGDSDRPLVAAVVPASDVGPGERRVRFLPGDLLGIVVAELLSAQAVAVPISANDAVERRMRERGIRLEKTKIGSPYVIAAMDGMRAEGRPTPIVGWEANGGFLAGSDIVFAGRTLTALPTRDSTLPIVANLFAAARERTTLTRIWGRLPARFGQSGLLDQVPVEVTRALMARLVPAGDVTEVDVASGPIPPWDEIRATLARVFRPALGFDDIVRINVVDGVRVTFCNGDIAHVRPSGNAPQLRIYANSDTQARADRIVADGLREPDGILRTLVSMAPPRS